MKSNPNTTQRNFNALMCLQRVAEQVIKKHFFELNITELDKAIEATRLIEIEYARHTSYTAFDITKLEDLDYGIFKFMVDANPHKKTLLIEKEKHSNHNMIETSINFLKGQTRSVL